MWPVETDGDLCQHLPSPPRLSGPSLAAFVHAPVSAGLCGTSFRACVPVLLSDVCLQAFLEPSCFCDVQNHHAGHPIIPLVSTPICLRGYGWGFLCFITVVVYLLFEKEIALLKNNWLT